MDASFNCTPSELVSGKAQILYRTVWKIGLFPPLKKTDVNVLVLLTILSPQLNCYSVMPTILSSIAF